MNKKTAKFLSGKKVLVYGATGGIGEAVVGYCHAHGAIVIAGGRNDSSLKKIKDKYGLKPKLFCSELSDYTNIYYSFEQINHEQNGINVNFTGIVNLLHATIPLLRENSGNHVAIISGYGDGRLSFSCHALNSACRSAIYTLMEALRRENRDANLNFLYYCPPAVNTKTEKAFLDLWKKLGTKIISPEAVAEDLVLSMMKRQHWHMHGSAIERFAVRMHSAMPQLADILFFDAMNITIEKYVAEKIL